MPFLISSPSCVLLDRSSNMLPQCGVEQRGAENPHDGHGLEAHG